MAKRGVFAQLGPGPNVVTVTVCCTDGRTIAVVTLDTDALGLERAQEVSALLDRLLNDVDPRHPILHLEGRDIGSRPPRQGRALRQHAPRLTPRGFSRGTQPATVNADAGLRIR